MKNYLLTLASLLHDIGKPAQRAGRPKNQHMETDYCPTHDKGYSTHLHTLYTDYFIENDLPLPAELERYRSTLARLASAHHKPAADSLEENALSRADRLSAGTDRLDEREDTGDHKTARLLSIFEQVSLGDEKSAADLAKGRHHTLTALGRDTFPTSREKAGQTGYEALFEEFMAEVGKLPLDQGVPHYIASLASLLERYTWCVPSSTYKTLPDISLYDHAATTAAIAQALYAYHQEQGGEPGHGEEAKFLLLGGDLSGIQHYIFSLNKSHGGGVAKLYRARSFYLQILTRSVILELLSRLGLSPLAKIMDAGGRFILLLPATDQVRRMLPGFEQEVQAWFKSHFQGMLSLNLCYSVTLTENDMKQGDFQKKLDEFNDSLEGRKLKKFDKLFTAGISPVVELNYQDYQQDGECAVCQARPADAESSHNYLLRHEKEAKVCRDCWVLMDKVGSRLPKAQWLVVGKGKKADSPALFGDHYMALLEGGNDQPPRVTEEIVELSALRPTPLAPHAPLAGNLPLIAEADLNRWSDLGLTVSGEHNETRFQDEKVELGVPKTFNMLAADSQEVVTLVGGNKETRGKSFLGVFKADVDNLGLIFSIGLGERLSISRFVALSRMLNHFFTEHLTEEIKKNYPDMYVVFSGGDDLFLLGPWPQAVRFAEYMAENFPKFVAHNHSISISAGIAVAKPGLPVHTLAHLAEEALEKSKHHEGKNAVTLFDTTVSWDDFTCLLDKGEWLFEMIREGKVPMALAGKLLTYGEEKRLFEKGDIQKYGLYKSHMSYDFARNINRETLPADDYRQIMDIQNDGFLLDNIKLPVSYAVYRLRKDD